jgi:hypothetical protein
MEALSSAVASLDLSNSTETVEPALAVSRTPASLLILPPELRLKIFHELLYLVPQGTSNTDTAHHLSCLNREFFMLFGIAVVSLLTRHCC